jgi:outer membrane protein TolC
LYSCDMGWPLPWPRRLTGNRVRVRIRLQFLSSSLAAGLFKASFAAAAATAATDSPLSLDEVLRESRAFNVRLPIPALEIAISRERVSEARAERWLKVAVEGDFIYAPPNGYDPAITNAGESRLQVVARQPIYDGGEHRAAIARGEADLESAGARYRIAEKDLELDVRSRYSEFLQSETEVATRREGIDRLQRYRTTLESRRASGQGVGADILKLDVRLASEQAALVDAQGRQEQARLSLNDLMGREPRAPLSLAPLPAPLPPDAAANPSLEGAPEVAAASAGVRAAQADVATTGAERKPHVFLTADFGFLGSDTSRLVPASLLATDPHANFGDRVRRDAGYSLGLFMSWPVWDNGGFKARVRQAELKLETARQNVKVVEREARREWAQARAMQQNVYAQIEILSQAAPTARDSFLEAESRYRGGSATALEVLDAHAASVDAAVKLSEAISRYRVAQALAIRWSQP